MKAIGLAALAGAMVWTAVTPASAEFFGCNEPHTKVSYSSSASRQAFAKAHYSTPRSAHPSSVQNAASRSRSAGLFAPYPGRSERW